MSAHHLDEEAIFHTARKIAPARRDAYLRQVCGDDALRGRIVALLQVHDDSQGFLQAPAVDLMGTVDTTPVAVKPGTRIGPYKLLEPLGEGGMGTVWMAEQSEPVKRLVALKVIKEGMDSAQVISRFEAERQALALMDHPNIARVLGAGATDAGRPYFVMELVKGIAITKYCDERRLKPRDRLALFIPVCHAVQHAHQKGVIHRDLKPSNVMIALYDGKPVPKVIDFGVAKATGQKLTEKTLYTSFGAIVGTLEYMSPEQAELNQLDIDTRSDIYSLGVLLYELLTGSTPLDHKRLKEGALLETLRLIREEEPPKPSARLSGSATLPALSAQRQTEPAKLSKLMRGELDWMVMKALEKDRARRYETANGLAQDIERYLKDEPVQAGPPSLTYRLRKFVKRNRGAVLGVAVVLLALLAGILGTTWGLLKAREQRDGAEQARQAEAKQRREAEEQSAKADKERTRALEAKNEADKERRRAEEATLQKAAQLARVEGLVYDLQFRDAYYRLQSFDLGQCRAVLDECRADLRGPEYAYLLNQLENKVRTLRGETGIWAQGGDGKRLVLGSKDGTLKVWDLETGKKSVVKGPVASPACLALSGDGRRLFVASGNSITVWDLEAGKEIFTLRGHTEPIDSLVLSGDGKRLVSGKFGGKTIKVWDLRTGTELRTLQSQAFLDLTLSRDGKRLVSNYEDKVKVWDLETGKESCTLSGHTRQVQCVLLRGDAKRLFSASHDCTIKEWDLQTGQEIRTLRGHGLEVLCLALSDDGKRLFSGSGDHTIKVWDAETGQEIRTLRGHASAVRSLALSHDGKRLFSAGGTPVADGAIKVWDVETGKETLSLRGHTGPVLSLALSADGKRLISRSWDRDNAIKVWNLETVNEARTLPGPFGHVVSLALSGDGKRLFLGEGYHVKLTGDGRRQYVPPNSAIKELDLETGKVTRILRGHADGHPVTCLALSADGRRLFSGSADNMIKVWDLDTGQEILTLRGYAQSVLSLVPSGDGKRLVSSSGNGAIKVWDLATGNATLTLRGQPAGGHEGQLLPLALSADGKRLFVGGQGNNISVWDLDTGKEILTLSHLGGVLSLALSGDGKRLFSGGAKHTIKVWDLETGKAAGTLRGHQGDVGSLALSGDGKRLFSGGGFFFGENAVKVWDVATGKELLSLPGHPIGVAALALSGDGERLASVGRDGAVKTWDLGAGATSPSAKDIRQPRFASIRENSSKQYQAWIERVEDAGYRPIFINALTMAGRTSFAGIAVKDGNDFAWAARHDWDRTGFEQQVRELAALDHRQIGICQYEGGGALLFGGTWVRDRRKLACVSHTGMTPQDLQKRIQESKDKGLQPLCVTGCAAGKEHRFAALFTDENIPRVAVHDLTSVQYQQALDEWKQKGYRPISISGYRAGDTTRFAAVFSQDDQVKQWIARHDLTSEQLDRLSKDWIAQGYEPIGIAAYPWEGDVRFATIWVRK